MCIGIFFLFEKKLLKLNVDKGEKKQCKYLKKSQNVSEKFFLLKKEL